MAEECTIPIECPSDEDFVELLEGRLARPEAAALETHLAGCRACSALVDELRQGDADLSDALAAALGEGPSRRTSIGRYRVLSLIGRGGMGEVHAAYDPELDRRVALKLLHTARSSEAARRRLLREARALGKLSHPNVVQVYDVGEHEGNVFVAMELVEGEPFDVWCRSAPGWQAVLAAYLDAARGLSAAHDKGLVHRDVKPSNILRGADGRVRVVDFGLAAAGHDAPSEDSVSEPPADQRIDALAGDTLALETTAPSPRSRPTEKLTATGALLGTPLYMAPEQYDGSRATPASDQYSLCTALYEGLYGALPFHHGPSGPVLIGDLMAHKREGVPLSPPAGSPVPAWVHRALLRGLAPRPEDRYPSIPALIAALGDEPPPRLRTLAEPASRVPRPLTPLVGRADEVREITARMRAIRLLTLTGTGGIGKSRLAIQVASDLQGELAGGAFFVELAPLSDPELVLHTVASALGVHEAPGRPLFDLLLASLRGRQALLVLDNCEHVLDAASHLAERLLHACADLRILATSRQSLGLTGEEAFRVPSLVAAEAVALFHERAGKKDDTAAVAQICQRLDGIPLAIELAAARTRVLSVAQIAARLDDRFRLLTDGSRSALPRHRTLKAAVDWGYQLLTDDEQRLLRFLSVFAGGCTLEAAEAVGGSDVLDLLANLVDKSLVSFADRYRLLETVRQFAAERLAERGETAEARARHLDYFVQLGEAASPHIFGGDSDPAWIARLDQENDNFRAALDFCEGGGPGDARLAEAALRLASSIHWFWFARGHLREARDRVTAALQRRSLAPTPVRAHALAAAGSLAMWIGDFAFMKQVGEESVAITEDLGDAAIRAYALCTLGAARLNTGDAAAGRPLLIEAVALARTADHPMLLCFVLYWLGTIALGQGDFPAARASLDEGLAIARRLGKRPGIGHNLFRLAEVAEAEGDHDEARRRWLESLRTLEESADRWGIAQVLDALGRLSVTAGRPARGARLLGAVEVLCELTGARILAGEHHVRAVEAARRALGEPAFEAAWAEGRALRIEEAIDLARRE